MSCMKSVKSMKFCPLSTGVALGLTAALGSLAWAFWVMYSGPTPMMVQFNIPAPTMNDALMSALWILLKGFAFGVVFALLYDLMVCCCKCKCCRGKSRDCGCATSCDCNCATACNCGCKNPRDINVK